MPMDDLYWNAIDFGSDDDELSIQHNPKHYVDPWDLENYAYIRDHLDSIDLSSNPSSCNHNDDENISNNGEFVDANSTSFYYVLPGEKGRQLIANRTDDSLITDHSNYMAIDELKMYERKRIRKELMDTYGPQTVTTPHYLTDIEENRPSSTGGPRDRSLSFSYGDHSYYPEDRSETYCRLDEYQIRKDATLPIMYDDLRRRKPNNFGLSNYGHLQIDYSYSWNNLNKYICK